MHLLLLCQTPKTELDAYNAQLKPVHLNLVKPTNLSNRLLKHGHNTLILNLSIDERFSSLIPPY